MEAYLAAVNSLDLDIFLFLESDYQRGLRKAHKSGYPRRCLIILLLVDLLTSHQRKSLGFMQ